MKNELDLDAIIEDYLKGNLSPEEQAAFEALRSSNPAVDHRVIEHKVFLSQLTSYGERAALQNKMDGSHAEIDIEELTAQYTPRPRFFIRAWRNNKGAIAIAASLIVVLFVSLYSLKTQQNGSYQEMRSELSRIKSSQNNLIRNINSSKASNTNAGRYGGTGFALSSNGYICTNYHVVKDADSIYVQNNKGESFKVQVAFSDPQYDLAILKITDSEFSGLPNLPYALKTSSIGLGEIVYTLGFPKDDAVLGEGYVSSKSGFGSDTTLAYQVAINVNPGNSGGPLLDNNGNIIGVISGKESNSDGAAFAVKSKYVLDALRAIPQDSLNNKIASSKRTLLQGLKRTKQIEKIQNYVFMVRVYN
ncbi:MAG: trypsin-like serine protease [Pedobacter sp.]|nr:MAG: trypsin-like serine protease [Pedobacter sp.]